MVYVIILNLLHLIKELYQTFTQHKKSDSLNLFHIRYLQTTNLYLNV